MTSDRTKRRHMGNAGFVSVGPVWLTPEQAATVQQWDLENRAKALTPKKETDQ